MGEQRRHDGYFDFIGIDSHYVVDDAYDNMRDVIQHQRMGVPASVDAARYTDGVAIIDDIESFRNRSGTVVTNAYDMGVPASVAPPNAARNTYDRVARNTSGIMFSHSPPFNHPTLPLPMQGMRGHSVYFHPPAPSYRLPSCGAARHVGAATSTDDRGVMHPATLGHPNLPPMGFIQLDDVALLPDHHTDLHLDIEDMSYEELLALGERIGNVSTRLSDEMVTTQMKTKTYSRPATASEEQETDICIICQLAALDLCHSLHLCEHPWSEYILLALIYPCNTLEIMEQTECLGNGNFYLDIRRCYWLLDKSLEHIVLVRYRETRELQGSPATPLNSNSRSVSDPTAPWILLEDLDSGTNSAYTDGLNDNLTVKSHEMRLHEINSLEWDDLVVSNENTSTKPTEDEWIALPLDL